MLSFSKEKVAKYFRFDEDSHTVQIIGDAPPEILKYSDESNNFDVKKLYENFLQCVYRAVSEMSKNPSEENFETLSIDWIPCTFRGKDRINDKLLDCMKTTFTRPEPIRCYHREGCDHQEGCGCHNYTSPSVTRSKIGKLLT